MGSAITFSAVSAEAWAHILRELVFSVVNIFRGAFRHHTDWIHEKSEPRLATCLRMIAAIRHPQLDICGPDSAVYNKHLLDELYDFPLWRGSLFYRGAVLDLVENEVCHPRALEIILHIAEVCSSPEDCQIVIDRQFERAMDIARKQLDEIDPVEMRAQDPDLLERLQEVVNTFLEKAENNDVRVLLLYHINRLR